VEDDALLRSLALWRAVVHRMRADWAVVLSAWVLLVAAATLLTAGTLYADAVALGGLRTSLSHAPDAGRSIRVSFSARASDAASLDRVVRDEATAAIDAGGGGDVWRFAASGPLGFATDDPATAKRITTLATRPDIEAHAALTAGSWPAAGGAGRQAALSVGAAAALGVKPGDRVQLVDRVHAGTSIDLVVSGTFAPDPSDIYWLGSGLDLTGVSEVSSFTSIGPFVVPEADLLGGEAGQALAYEWRVVPDVGRLTVEGIEPLRSATSALTDRLRATLPPGQSPQVTTDLPKTLSEIAGSVLVSRSGIIVLILEFGVVAAYAIVLVAGLLGDRRRTETTLLRSRGGSARSVVGMAALEATILAVGAALVAPLLSLGVIRLLAAAGALGELGAGADIGVTPGAYVADLVGAGIGIVAMTLPTVTGSAELAGVRAAMSRPVGRTLGQRLGLDLALVVLAGIGLWQLRLYGAPLTRNIRGVLGVDPLLVAAPAIGLIAGALLATRAVPRLAEVALPLLERGRGLVASIGGRAVARRPLRYTRSALLLMLAAALGTFSVADVATWTRSQSDQAAYQAGADVRIVGTRVGTVDATALGPAYRALPGVTAAMPVDRYSADSGRSVRGATLLALDSTVAAGIVLPPADVDAAGFAALFPQLATSRPTETNLLPADARRLVFVVEPNLTAEFLPDPTFVPDLASDQGIQIAFVLEDATGRLHRYQAVDGFLAGHGQRLEADLPSGGSFGIRAIEVTVAPNGPVGVTGTLEITDVQTSSATTGESWTSLPGFPAPGSAWTWPGQGEGTGPATFHPPVGHPLELQFGGDTGQIASPFGFGGPITVRLAWLPGGGTVPVIVSAPFLTLTSAAVGDELPATIQGTPIRISIVATVDEFPTLDPAKPFVIADGRTVALARFISAGSFSDPGEWWLATSNPDGSATAAALGPDPGAKVITRVGLQRELAGDPSALGVIGLLGLGSIAAMVFAAIGFVVSAAVSTSERAGELALLRALGLSAGEVSAWLSFEHMFLLVIGIGAGVGLGALLAWLVLPFSTLTQSGLPPVPMPVVVVPLVGLLPIVLVALAIFALTTLALRRQLGRVEIGTVLRARAE
jgi:hypothetical protein